MLDSVHLEGAGWRTPPQGFFRPAAGEGPLPSGFEFTLPTDLQGMVRMDMVVAGVAPATLRPRLLPPSAALALKQRHLASATAIYASLAVLALVALSLFTAARDRAYLALFTFTSGALVLLLAVNGHLYTLPGLRLAGLWGVQGVWALVLLVAAASLWLAQRYAELPLHAPALLRASNRYIVGLLGLAALCLLNLSSLAGPMRWLATAAWLGAGGIGVAAAIVAVRQRLWMGVPILIVTTLLVVAGVLREFALEGIGPGGFWLRFGYQVALAGCAFLVALGLIGRIAHVRAERDRERLARDDSERRLQREAARADLVQHLRHRLRELPPGDMEWTGFRAMFERLLPLLELESGVLIAYGYHGFDLLLADPLSSKPGYTQLLSTRVGMLKGLARTQAPLQLQLDEPDAGERIGLHAVVPLPIRAPAWGVLLLRRAGDAGFTHDELALAADFGRLVVQYVDEAATALNLRRSAELDSLTGALNRRTIDLWLARTFTEAHGNGQPVSVLFVDIDHFKVINDTHGHACGDLCLRHVSETLRRELDATDMLGRYGGEEFLLVLPGHGAAAARLVGERICAAVQSGSLECGGATISLTVSIGVATRLPHEDTPAAAVERADKALYVAKRSGRNQVSVAPATFI
jgi:diguanylate cyclase (GGDEF)-like protein